MKKLYYLLILFFCCGICDSQNLVPNGDFEQYSGCPDDVGQIDSALFWVNIDEYSHQAGSPDYFNQCAGNLVVGVPSNVRGWQMAHSGNAYCGIGLFAAQPNYREYIQTSLSAPLIANQTYHFEMYVSLADVAQFTVDSSISVFFSDTLYTHVNNYNPLPLVPQLNYLAGNLPDVMNWTLRSGNYVAQGGESVLIIGNFRDDAHTDTIYSNGSGFLGSFLFIDDVTLTLNTGIEVQTDNAQIKISPNPFSDNLTITTKTNRPSEITLYDITSRILLQQTFTNTTSINTSHLASGMYIYEVRNNKEVIKKGKVVKE